uniref:3-oxoacyl-[acyl-carrier-protein] reductase n=1 Tax=Heterorhabditis bacteriophora TaxID=37862 RepID=A0A1I7XGZ5_HETBA
MPVAIITGASSGIGRATALLFAKNRYQLSLTGRNEGALKDVAEECVQQGISERDITISALDLCSNDAHQTVIKNTLGKFKNINCLVSFSHLYAHHYYNVYCVKFKNFIWEAILMSFQINSAGILKTGSVLESDMSLYDELFNINVKSLVRLTREAIPYIIKTRGSVVNISSINGPCPFPGVTYYCMSKSAVDQFTKCLALEMAPHRVRVNAVKWVVCYFVFGSIYI